MSFGRRLLRGRVAWLAVVALFANLVMLTFTSAVPVWHVAFRARVLYRWHPAFESAIDVLYEERFAPVGTDLETAWNAPTTERTTKQRLVPALIEEIVVDVDDTTGEVVLLVHWRRGQHSDLRVRKPAAGEHNKRAPEETEKAIREMATRWSDDDIAATHNRMALPTGQGMTWNAIRVGAYRRTAGIHGYESAVKDGRCLTMVEAAAKAGVTCHAIRRLIKSGILPARQVLFDAPWQILAADLERAEVRQALRRRNQRAGRPCRDSRDDRALKIPGT